MYDGAIHPALSQSPREAFKPGLLLGGERLQRTIRYDEQFTYLSLATTRKGSAKVEPGRGVKIHFLYYGRGPSKRVRSKGAQVPVRYDPFDIGTAYAYVHGRWVKCLSEYHLQLRGHSERELQLASAELHKGQPKPRGRNSRDGEAVGGLPGAAPFKADEAVLFPRMHCTEKATEVFVCAWKVIRRFPMSRWVHPVDRTPPRVQMREPANLFVAALGCRSKRGMRRRRRWKLSIPMRSSANGSIHEARLSPSPLAVPAQGVF